MVRSFVSPQSTPPHGELRRRGHAFSEAIMDRETESEVRRGSRCLATETHLNFRCGIRGYRDSRSPTAHRIDINGATPIGASAIKYISVIDVWLGERS